MRCFTFLFACLLSWLLCLPSAVAQTDAAKAKAKERFVRGIDRMEAEDYAGAASEFEQAYEHAPFAVILFNLGIAYAKLQRPVKAVDALERVVAEPGSLSEARVRQAKATMAKQRERIGRLAVSVDVEGATVRVDGIDVGTTPLTAAVAVRGGLHFVEAIKAGYAPSRREVSVAGEAEAKVALSLEPTAAGLGQLWVRADLPGAAVYLDDVRVGTTPMSASLPVVPGEHRVELRRDGYRRAADLVKVGVGATAELFLAPRPDKVAIAKSGSRLALQGEDVEGLVVTVDGERFGIYAGPMALAPGPHALVLERGGFLSSTVEVEVPTGATLERMVVLQPTPETVEAHDARVASYRIGAWSTLAAGLALAGAGVGYTIYNEGVRSDKDEVFSRELVNGGRCDDSGVSFDRDFCLDLAEDIDSATSRRPIGYGLMAAGGASLVASIVLFAVMPDADRFRSDLDEDAEQVFARLEPVWSVGRAGASVGLTGRF